MLDVFSQGSDPSIFVLNGQQAHRGDFFQDSDRLFRPPSSVVSASPPQNLRSKEDQGGQDVVDQVEQDAQMTKSPTHHNEQSERARQSKIRPQVHYYSTRAGQRIFYIPESHRVRLFVSKEDAEQAERE
ncbi:unnamed protein product, partial [Amoebophrya sp. A25]|eukprot:GSA25T00012102001.1